MLYFTDPEEPREPTMVSRCMRIGDIAAGAALFTCMTPTGILAVMAAEMILAETIHTARGRNTVSNRLINRGNSWLSKLKR